MVKAKAKTKVKAKKSKTSSRAQVKEQKTKGKAKAAPKSKARKARADDGFVKTRDLAAQFGVPQTKIRVILRTLPDLDDKAYPPYSWKPGSKALAKVEKAIESGLKSTANGRKAKRGKVATKKTK